MKNVQLLAIGNKISSHEGTCVQQLDFYLRVKNQSPHKAIDVCWAGSRSDWQTLAARYVAPSNACMELWMASSMLHAVDRSELPGTIQAAVRCRMSGQEYWDNNSGCNYRSEGGCGIVLAAGLDILVAQCPGILHEGQESYQVLVAVREPHPDRVWVQWTADAWKSCCTTGCRPFFPDAGQPAPAHCAGAASLWSCTIPVGGAYALEYAAACRTGETVHWDNNLGANYRAHHRRFSLLTLNLHCFQEDHQDEKFTTIARAIDDLNVDVVCLQEAGDSLALTTAPAETNAARIIAARLARHYHVFWDWSHIGFDAFREGIAILSRHPFLDQDAAFVSAETSPHTVDSRKVCAVTVSVPFFGPVILYSVHLSWWSGGFARQFENLRARSLKKTGGAVAAILLCGDFNAEADGPGYRLASPYFEDQYRAAVLRQWYRGSRERFDSWAADDRRIDHVLMNRGGRLQAVAARELFTPFCYGQVSDHSGYCVEFEPVC